MERTLRGVAGAFLLISLLLAHYVSPCGFGSQPL